jgi:hypothetical protein
MRTIVLAATAAALGLAVSGPARADTITFDAAQGIDFPTSYTEQGYSFTTSSPFLVLNNNSYSGHGDPTDQDASDASGVLEVVSEPYDINISRVGGGAFNFGSLKLGDADGQGESIPMLVTFNYVGGGTSQQSFSTDFLASLQTFVFNQTNLLSVSFKNTDASGFQIDDVEMTVAATPVPPAVAMFMTALAGLGFAGWRRNKTVA